MSLGPPLQLVFDIDIEHCPNCGGVSKIIAASSTDSGQELNTAGDRQRSSATWAYRPAPRRVPQLVESIYSRQSDSRKALANARRRCRSPSIRASGAKGTSCAHRDRSPAEPTDRRVGFFIK